MARQANTDADAEEEHNIIGVSVANETKEDYTFVDGTEPEGIVNPSADALIGKAESKYGLVIFGARRARQINAYYANLQENTADYTGPLVDSEPNDKALSVAMREIMSDQIVAEHMPEGRFDENGLLVREDFSAAMLDIDEADFISGVEEEYIPAGTEEVIAIEEVVLDNSTE